MRLISVILLVLAVGCGAVTAGYGLKLFIDYGTNDYASAVWSSVCVILFGFLTDYFWQSRYPILKGGDDQHGSVE